MKNKPRIDLFFIEKLASPAGVYQQKTVVKLAEFAGALPAPLPLASRGERDPPSGHAAPAVNGGTPCNCLPSECTACY